MESLPLKTGRHKSRHTPHRFAIFNSLKRLNRIGKMVTLLSTHIGLENRRRGNPSEGSNPSLSANFRHFYALGIERIRRIARLLCRFTMAHESAHPFASFTSTTFFSRMSQTAQETLRRNAFIRGLPKKNHTGEMA